MGIESRIPAVGNCNSPLAAPTPSDKRGISAVQTTTRTIGSRACVVCGRPFAPNGGRQLTCSAACRTAHRKALRQRRWELLPHEERERRLRVENEKRLPTPKICLQCDAKFHPRKSNQVHCSRACVDAARRKPKAVYIEPRPDPERAQRLKYDVASLRRSPFRWWFQHPRRSDYAKKLRRLGLPECTSEAARALGLSYAALRARIHRHIHSDPSKLLAAPRPYCRKPRAAAVAAERGPRTSSDTLDDKCLVGA